MAKLIREILRLAWKAIGLVFWKWVRPLLGRLFFYALAVTGLILLVVVVASRV